MIIADIDWLQKQLEESEESFEEEFFMEYMDNLDNKSVDNEE